MDVFEKRPKQCVSKKSYNDNDENQFSKKKIIFVCNLGKNKVKIRKFDDPENPVGKRFKKKKKLFLKG